MTNLFHNITLDFVQVNPFFDICAVVYAPTKNNLMRILPDLCQVQDNFPIIRH